MVFEIKDYFRKINKAIFDCEIMVSTSEEAEKYNGTDIASTQTIEKHMGLIEDAIIQNEKCAGIALTRLLPDILELQNAFKECSVRIDFAGITDNKDPYIYLSRVNRNFDIFICRLKECCDAYGIDLPNMGDEEDEYSEPQQIVSSRKSPKTTRNTDFLKRLIGDDETQQRTLQKLRRLIEGKKGKYVAMVIQCAITSKLISKPTYPELKKEFKLGGSAQAYNKSTDIKFDPKETAPIIEYLKSTKQG